jgi:hypothetical protein
MATSAQTQKVPLKELEDRAYAIIELAPAEADAVASVAAVAPAFFRLPADEKGKSRLGPAAGYCPYGIEYSNSPEHPDEMETFSATAASASQRAAVPPGTARDLHDRTTEAFQLLEPIAERIIVALAEDLTGQLWSASLQNGLHRWSCLQVRAATRARQIPRTDAPVDWPLRTERSAENEHAAPRRRHGYSR